MLAVVFLLLPMVLVTGSFLLTMTGRTDRLLSEVADEQAFQAAEAGVDATIHAARIGALTSGVNVVDSLPGGSSFVAIPIHLGSDLLDNDGDSLTDEPDEDLFQVVVTGKHRREQRRLATYLGRTSFLPTVDSAVAVSNPSLTIDVSGNTELSGLNYNLDGTLGDPAFNTEGMSITPPGTTANLLSELSPVEQGNVVGSSPSPSLGTSATIDFAEVVEQARNSASIVLTNSTYNNATFGTPVAGAITFRTGDVRLGGNTTGAGLLVVTGDLTIQGNFRYDGVIVVLGDVYNGSGTVQIYGGLLQAAGGNDLTLRGTVDVRFSLEALAIADSLTGRYVAFNGWQEISRN